MRALLLAAFLPALTVLLSGCMEGAYIGWDAEARFSEYDEQILRDATEALSWNASFHGTMPGFSADLPKAVVYYGERGSGYVFVVQFSREVSVPHGQLDGEDKEDRADWEPIFETLLGDFERETGWTHDGIRWLRIHNG